MAAPTTSIPTPVIGTPDDGAGDVASLFPTIIPEVEQVVYDRIEEACNSRTIFPSDGQGLTLPAVFSIPPDVSLYRGRDGTYTIPVGPNAGQPIPPIAVTRGWVPYPGQIPAIGVTESTTTEDPGEDTIQGGFAGDVAAVDQNGVMLATCAYYAEPLQTTVIVELVHTNRDERDRLAKQLRRVLFPLRHLIAKTTSQVRNVKVSGPENQELPVEEQPIVMYVALFTIEVSAEALIPTEIVPGGAIESIDITVTPTQITEPDAEPDYT